MFVYMQVAVLYVFVAAYVAPHMKNRSTVRLHYYRRHCVMIMMMMMMMEVGGRCLPVVIVGLM